MWSYRLYSVELAFRSFSSTRLVFGLPNVAKEGTKGRGEAASFFGASDEKIGQVFPNIHTDRVKMECLLSIDDSEVVVAGLIQNVQYRADMKRIAASPKIIVVLGKLWS